MKPEKRAPTKRASFTWSGEPVPSVFASGLLGLRAHFTRDDCERWTRGTYAAREEWTADFGDDQYSLGRAFYTHLEQGKSGSYFADATASDARVEAHAPGLQSAMRDLGAAIVNGAVRPRRGWCSSGIHVFPAGGHAAKHGGVVHFDTEGLTVHHLARRGRALSIVAMLQAPVKGGGLRVWDATYIGDDGAPAGYARTPNVTALYREGDVVAFDSYRLHQIQPFAGARDRISATLHLVEVDAGQWESWF